MAYMFPSTTLVEKAYLAVGMSAFTIQPSYCATAREDRRSEMIKIELVNLQHLRHISLSLLTVMARIWPRYTTDAIEVEKTVATKYSFDGAKLHSC